MTKNLNRFYEGLMDDLARDVDTRYLELLKEKPRTWVHQNMIFDLDKLDAYYRCDTCKKRKPRAFCCRGYDVEMTRHDLKLLEKHAPAVLAAEPAIRRAVGAAPLWRRGDTLEPLLRRKKNDECIFLRAQGGCSLHGWALATGRDPLEVKPYICSLYPVVVIIIDDQIVITTFSDESRAVLESGERAVSCIQARGSRERHVLVQGEAILARMFGPKIIRELMKRVLE
jgi:hypothetical protein